MLQKNKAHFSLGLALSPQFIMKITPQNKKFIQVVKGLLLICCSALLTSCAHVSKYSFERIGDCNYQVQSGNFADITKTYEEATKLRDRNYALWDNQLGSIYLAQGDYDKALDAFLRAHYLMNNIPAFKELERKAVSLTGSEDIKAYKGDPYEKAMNSLYVGLLLYNKGDLENAIAAFKNGILADSDSKGEACKSDIAIFYLLASRIAKKLGNESLSNDYHNAVKELFNNSDYSVLGFNDELIQKILNLKNNILLVVEFGEGPYKSRRGKYGELAVINGDRYNISGWNIKIDGKVNAENQVYSNTDVYFQASTRGGRKMDGILKGKAQFKTNTANTSVAALDLSGQFLNQANQTSDPYAQAALAAAAGISGLISGGAAIMSAITNPKADIRYWSLLPEHVIVFPLFIPPGKHKINIEFNDEAKAQSNYEFDVNIQKDKDNIIFKRILRYQVSTNSGVFSSKIAKLGENTGISEDLLKRLIDKGMEYRNVEYLLGTPSEKRKDSLGREVWIYPSDKPGFSNNVYFTGGCVSELNNQPIKEQVKERTAKNENVSSHKAEGNYINLLVGIGVIVLVVSLIIFLIWRNR